MKLSILFLSVILLLSTGSIAGAGDIEDECLLLVQDAQRDGYLYVTPIVDEGLVLIEPLLWKHSTYRTKFGIAYCIALSYNLKKVSFSLFDRPKETVAVYDGESFEIY